jgi:Resolvase, N terminal domain
MISCSVAGCQLPVLARLVVNGPFYVNGNAHVEFRFLRKSASGGDGNLPTAPIDRGTMRQIISYIRVSTGKQGRTGLGIEAQREAVARFAAAEGREVVAEFVEVETGKGSDTLDRRPKLAEAGDRYSAAREGFCPLYDSSEHACPGSKWLSRSEAKPA